jgi:hypothetical protein
MSPLHMSQLVLWSADFNSAGKFIYKRNSTKFRRLYEFILKIYTASDTYWRFKCFI